MRWTELQLLAHKSKKEKPKESVYNADEGLENDLDNKIRKFLNENGFYGFHDISRGKNKKGHPDWVIALPNGRVVWIENKSKTGKLTKEQKENMIKLLGLGQEFYECRSFKQFLDIIYEKK